MCVDPLPLTLDRKLDQKLDVVIIPEPIELSDRHPLRSDAGPFPHFATVIDPFRPELPW